MTLIERLLNLYRVETQVRGLRSRLDAAQRYLQAQESQVSQIRAQLDELESRRRQAQATVANLETETKSIDERIEKLRNELNSAENNKQYTAVLSELNTVKTAHNEVEERQLAEMERVEDLAAQAAELQEQAAERRKVREIAEQQLQERRNEVGDRLAELEAERDAAAAELPAEALGIFDELASTYEGEVMAPIQEVSRRHREYACGACNMQMPFDAVSQLLGGADAVVRCPACGRILYMQDEMRGALARK